MDDTTRKKKLRSWYLKHPCETLGFFEGYKWLEEGLEKGDLDLRKLCMNSTYGLFRTPAEVLDWVENGTIPDYLSTTRTAQTPDKTEI